MGYAYFTITRVLWFRDSNTKLEKFQIVQENAFKDDNIGFSPSVTFKKKTFNKHSNVSDSDSDLDVATEENYLNNEKNKKCLTGCFSRIINLSTKDSPTNREKTTRFIEKENESLSMIKKNHNSSIISRNYSSNINSKRSIRSVKRKESIKSIASNIENNKYSNTVALNSLVYQLKLYDSNTKIKYGTNMLGMKNTILHTNERKENIKSIPIVKFCINGKPMQPRRNDLAIFKLIKSRKRVVKLLIVLVLLFMCSWLPYHLIAISIEILLFQEEKYKIVSSKIKNSSSHDQGSETGSSLLTKNILN
jgi:hypothetical protein